MITLHTFEDVHNQLRTYYANTRTPYTLDAPRKLLRFLGNPQEQLKVVHIAGTSGKTSTSYYASSLLEAAGHSVGLFVSPHVDEVNERLQINNRLLPEVEYCAILSEFLTLIEDAEVKPSYFELVMALAFWEFARRGLEYAVIEVGLGGLLDATNLVERSDKICIITDIGLDHTEILGDTIEEIAFQKAGIIQPGNRVYMHEQPDNVVAVISERAKQQEADLTVLEANSQYVPTDLPLFQQRNLSLAAAALDSHRAAIKTAATITIPARLETFKRDNKTIIVDGSHNDQKLTALFMSIDAIHGRQDIAVLCAFVQGNEQRWQRGIDTIFKHSKHVIFTVFGSEQDVKRSSVNAKEIQAYCESRNYSGYEIVEDPAAAYDRLLAQKASVLLVTGSFYLLHSIRPRIMNI